MKTLFLFAIVGVFYCSGIMSEDIPAGTGEEADCGKYLDAGCTKEYGPVCGANNILYANECVFCKETKGKIKIKNRGECRTLLTTSSK
ncbi:ovomucoid [Polypterus senegalus]|nr:ovomucoid [Polypterus senegalus]